MRTLIIGANGMLGHALQPVFPGAVCWDVGDIDITDSVSAAGKIAGLKPELIINSAGFTNVEACEDSKNLCFAVNGYALETLAKVAKRINAVLVHFSSDYVFDGKKKGYAEADKTCPINAYGLSKELGEKLLMRNADKYFLIRTSWLFGRHGKNFVDTMLRLSSEKPELRVVNDQYGSPTYTDDLAAKVKALVAANKFGIYHVTNSGVCTWFDFAKRILELKSVKTPVVPISAAEYPSKLRRPEFSILLNNKTASLRHWELALKDYLGV